MTDPQLPPPASPCGDMISETELHAWLDGELSAERCAAVTDYLAAHPEVAERMRRHRAQMQMMRRAFEPLLDRPVPQAMTRLLAAGSRDLLWRRRAVLGLAAAGIAALLLVTGWMAHRAMPPAENYVAEAITAYRLAVIDRAANGVWAITPEGLPGTLERLSRRVGVPLQVPALAEQGFTITSGRLVPASEGATAAQFIYQRDREQLTIYVRPTPLRGESNVVMSRQPGGLIACSWRDEGIAFVLVSNAPMSDVLAISGNVYRTADTQ
jgi:anti-sigma factor RsiW